jgi:hypothetical protein
LESVLSGLHAAPIVKEPFSFHARIVTICYFIRLEILVNPQLIMLPRHLAAIPDQAGRKAAATLEVGLSKNTVSQVVADD